MRLKKKRFKPATVPSAAEARMRLARRRPGERVGGEDDDNVAATALYAGPGSRRPHGRRAAVTAAALTNRTRFSSDPLSDHRG